MPESIDLTNWQPLKLPSSVTLEGRFMRLEPLSAAKHAAALWHAVTGHDEVWAWLGDGPYASEAELAEALKTKEKGTAARFYAIVPVGIGEATGYASLMRMDP